MSSQICRSRANVEKLRYGYGITIKYKSARALASRRNSDFLRRSLERIRKAAGDIEKHLCEIIWQPGVIRGIFNLQGVPCRYVAVEKQHFTVAGAAG
jgi:uncharacterized protein YbcV (DUF1398 family)